MNLLLRYMVALSGLLILVACSNTTPSLPESDNLPAQGFEAEVVPLSGVGSSATAPRLLIRPSLAAQPASPTLTKSTRYNLAGQAMVIWGDMRDPMKGTLTVSVDGLGSITKLNTDFASTGRFNNQPRGCYCVSVTWDLHNSKYSSVRTTPVTHCQWASEDNIALYQEFRSASDGIMHTDSSDPSLHEFSIGKEFDFDVFFSTIGLTTDNPPVTLTTPMQRPVFLLRIDNYAGVAEITSATMKDGVCSIMGGITTCIANHAVAPIFPSNQEPIIILKVMAKETGRVNILTTISSTSIIGHWEKFTFLKLQDAGEGERTFSLNVCLDSSGTYC